MCILWTSCGCGPGIFMAFEPLRGIVLAGAGVERIERMLYVKEGVWSFRCRFLTWVTLNPEP